MKIRKESMGYKLTKTDGNFGSVCVSRGLEVELEGIAGELKDFNKLKEIMIKEVDAEVEERLNPKPKNLLNPLKDDEAEILYGGTTQKEE